MRPEQVREGPKSRFGPDAWTSPGPGQDTDEAGGGGGEI